MQTKNTAKTLFKFVACSLAVTLLSCLLALLLTRFTPTPYFSILFYVSIAVVVLGCFACMKGSPSGVYQGTRTTNPVFSSTAIDSSTSQTTEKDRGNLSYYKSFFESSVLEATYLRLSIIFGGVLSIFVVMIFDR